MKYLLDSNACIRYLNGRSANLRHKIHTTQRSDLAVCAITKAELFYGSAKSQAPLASLQRQIEFLETMHSIPFDDAAAHAYGPIRAELERMGTPIGQHDLLIGAIAVAWNFILITHNTREFGCIPQLRWDDWEL